MIGLSDIQAKDEIRRTMAEQIAAWEAENGPVQTLPIFVGDRPQPSFTVTVPGKPVAHQQSQKMRKADHDRVTMRTAKKLEKLAKVRDLAAKGLTIAQMAEQSGFTAKYCQRLILENGIVRGRQTDLEA